MPRRWSPVVAGITLVLIMSACGRAATSTKAVAADQSAYSTPLLRVASQGERNGKLDRDTSLQVFAWQFGALPGVQTPKGKPGIDASGDLAIRGVMRHWAELSEPQRAAISKRLGLPPGFTPNARRGLAGKARVRFTPSSSAFPKQSDAIFDILERHYGVLPVQYWISKSGADPIADGATLVRDGTNGFGCYVDMYNDIWNDTEKLTLALAHELFHCYQLSWVGDASDWIMEGGAAWVAANVATELGYPADPYTHKLVTNYAQSPLTPLFRRTYDAGAWFGYVAEAGVDMWARMKGVVMAGDDGASYQVATAGLGQEFVDSWGTAQMEYEPWGGLWTISSPGMPTITTSYNLAGAAIANGGGFTMDAPGYASGRKSVKYSAELTRIALTGTGGGFERNADGNRNLATLTGKTWCTNPKTVCKCPPNTRRAGEEFPALVTGNRTLALAGGPSGAQVVVTGTSLEDECNKRSCMVGTWRLNSPPTGTSLNFRSGGTGAILTVTEQGAMSYDFTPSERVELAGSGLNLGIKYNGVARGDVSFPKDPNGGQGSFTNVDTSELSATDITINGASSISGLPTTLIADAVTKAFRDNFFSPDGTFQVSCPGNGLVLSNAVSTVAFTKVGK